MSHIFSKYPSNQRIEVMALIDSRGVPIHIGSVVIILRSALQPQGTVAVVIEIEENENYVYLFTENCSTKLVHGDEVEVTNKISIDSIPKILFRKNQVKLHWILKACNAKDYIKKSQKCIQRAHDLRDEIVFACKEKSSVGFKQTTVKQEFSEALQILREAGLIS